jgi:hypothetical protein
MKYILIICLFLCGCETSRTTTEATQATKEVARQEITLVGEVAGMPISLTAKAKSDTITQTKTDSKETTEVPVEASMGWLPELIAGLFGGGTILALIKKIMTYKATLGHIVGTIEDQPDKIKKSILPQLSRKMDRKNKDLIKKMKG